MSLHENVAHAHVCSHVCMCVCAWKQTNSYLLSVSACIHWGSYTHTYTAIPALCLSRCANFYICILVHLHTFLLYIFTNKCTHIHIYTWICIFIKYLLRIFTLAELKNSQNNQMFAKIGMQYGRHYRRLLDVCKKNHTTYFKTFIYLRSCIGKGFCTWYQIKLCQKLFFLVAGPHF